MSLYEPTVSDFKEISDNPLIESVRCMYLMSIAYMAMQHQIKPIQFDIWLDPKQTLEPFLSQNRLRLLKICSNIRPFLCSLWLYLVKGQGSHFLFEKQNA